MSKILTIAITLALAAGAARAQNATTTIEARPVPPPAPPPVPYSLPWQLRPVTVATVVRSDTSVAFYKAGSAGSTLVSSLLGTFKLTPELAPLFRVAVVQNSEPGPTVGS